MTSSADDCPYRMKECSPAWRRVGGELRPGLARFSGHWGWTLPRCGMTFPARSNSRGSIEGASSEAQNEELKIMLEDNTHFFQEPDEAWPGSRRNVQVQTEPRARTTGRTGAMARGGTHGILRKIRR
ncbi:hypothetical protein NDU88_002595 [Pleurodeles waltl]|uniref:Uncharacterized protein n=1 Tax=Pleurodeles waltl TaxID=8319 RepID=A0AAV7MPC6_PLEWA|nr:hypothetical protein NDU88_002595 [Pleurodeles waltl]